MCGDWCGYTNRFSILYKSISNKVRVHFSICVLVCMSNRKSRAIFRENRIRELFIHIYIHSLYTNVLYGLCERNKKLSIGRHNVLTRKKLFLDKTPRSLFGLGVVAAPLLLKTITRDCLRTCTYYIYMYIKAYEHCT